MPGKMFVPIVLTRMIEPHGCAADRIKRVDLVVLFVVAALTSQSKVVSRRRAADRFRDDVFVGVILRGVGFGADAVFTAALGAFFDQFLQFDREVAFSHAARA